MTAPLPTAIPADGYVKSTFVSALASVTVPTATELNAGTDLQCYLSELTPGTDQSSIADQRICQTQDFERPGRKKESLEVTYVYQGQDPAAADNEAQATLAEGTAGYLAVRWGAPHAAAWAANDLADVWPFTAGVAMKMPPEADGILRIKQKLFITNVVQRDVEVA